MDTRAACCCQAPFIVSRKLQSSYGSRGPVRQHDGVVLSRVALRAVGTAEHWALWFLIVDGASTTRHINGTAGFQERGVMPRRRVAWRRGFDSLSAERQPDRGRLSSAQAQTATQQGPHIPVGHRALFGRLPSREVPGDNGDEPSVRSASPIARVGTHRCPMASSPSRRAQSIDAPGGDCGAARPAGRGRPLG